MFPDVFGDNSGTFMSRLGLLVQALEAAGLPATSVRIARVQMGCLGVRSEEQKALHKRLLPVAKVMLPDSEDHSPGSSCGVVPPKGIFRLIDEVGLR